MLRFIFTILDTSIVFSYYPYSIIYVFVVIIDNLLFFLTSPSFFSRSRMRSNSVKGRK